MVKRLIYKRKRKNGEVWIQRIEILFITKSKIIKEPANKEISLKVTFNRLLIVTSNIGNTDLIDWAINKLNGYSNDSKMSKC